MSFTHTRVPALLALIALLTLGCLADQLIGPDLASAGTLSGRVVSSAETETPVADIAVYALRRQTDGSYQIYGNPSWTSRTGRFTKANLPAGTYKLMYFDHLFHWRWEFEGDTQSEGAARTLNVGATSAATVPTAALDPLAPRVSGTLLEAGSGAFVPGSYVEVYHRVDNEELVEAWSYPDSDGRYWLGGVDDGPHHVGGFGPNNNWWADWETNVWFFAGQEAKGIDLQLTPLKFRRLGGADRYQVALAIARQQVGTDGGFNTVVLASGADAAAADPLTAAGLCWSYQVTDTAAPSLRKPAPLLLTPSGPIADSLAVQTAGLLSEIAGRNPGKRLRLVIVGGTRSVPQANVDRIVRAARAKGVVLTVERLLAGGDRYQLASAVAIRMNQRANLDASDTIEPTTTAIVACGSETAGFYDALTVAPISARRGVPLLLTTREVTPSSTRSALRMLAPDPSRVYCVTTRLVSTAQLTRLGVPESNRIVARDYYTLSAQVATLALNQGWLSARVVGVASKLPDALCGGVFLGSQEGPLLYVEKDAAYPAVRSFLISHNSEVARGWVFGGKESVTNSLWYNLCGWVR